MPVIPFIPAIIAAAGATAGAAVQAHSANKAVDAQTRASNKALELNQDVLHQQQQNLNPYIQSGNMSLNRLNGLLGGSGPQGGGMTTFGQKPEVQVLVTSPTGQQMMRPISEADHWQQRGATIAPLQGQVGSGDPRSMSLGSLASGGR